MLNSFTKWNAVYKCNHCFPGGKNHFVTYWACITKNAMLLTHNKAFETLHSQFVGLVESELSLFEFSITR